MAYRLPSSKYMAQAATADYGDLKPRLGFSPMRTLFKLLDYPGNVVRSTLMGDPMAGLLGRKTYTGADLLESAFGIKNKRGQLDWADVPAIGTEILLDPMTYLSGGATKLAKAQAQLAKAGLTKIDDITRAASVNALRDAAVKSPGQQKIIQAFDLLDNQIKHGWGGEFRTAKKWGEQVRRGERDLLRFMGKKIPIPNEAKLAQKLQNFGKGITGNRVTRALTKPFISGFSKYDQFTPEMAEQLDELAPTMKSTATREAIKAIDFDKFGMGFAEKAAAEHGTDLTTFLDDMDQLVETHPNPYGKSIAEQTAKFDRIKQFASGITDPARQAKAQKIMQARFASLLGLKKNRADYISRFGTGIDLAAKPANALEGFAQQLKQGYKKIVDDEAAIGLNITPFESERVAYGKRVPVSLPKRPNPIQKLMGMFRRGPMNPSIGAQKTRKEIYRDLLKPEIVDMQKAKVKAIMDKQEAFVKKAEEKLSRWASKPRYAKNIQKLNRAMSARLAKDQARIAAIPEKIFKTNPIESFTHRQLEHAQAMSKAQFVQDYVKLMPKVAKANIAKGDTSYVPLAKLFESVKMRVPDHLADQFIKEDYIGPLVDRFKRWNVDESMQGALGMYDKALSAWKGMHTAVHPAFTVRNLFSGVTQNAQQGNLDPKTFKLAKDIMSGGKLSQPIRTASGRVIEDTGEALRWVIENQAATNDLTYDLMARVKQGDITGIGDLLEPKGMSLRRGLKDNLKTAVSQNPLNTGRQVSQEVENVNRVALFLDQVMNKGATEKSALKAVNEAMFDYGDLSEFERNVMRRVIPFYTFTRKNLPFQAKWLSKHPKTALNTGRAIGLNEDAKDRVMPAYLREQAAIPLGKDKEGNPQYLSSLGLPFEEAVSRLPPMSMNVNDWKRYGQKMLSMITPAAKIPLELSMDRNTFTGRPIGDMDRIYAWTSKLPDAVKKQIGYREWTDKQGRKHYRADPYLLYMLSNMGGGRFYSTLNKATDERKGKLARAMNALSGINITSVDEDRERGYQEREMFMNLVEELKRRGLAEDFTTQYLTETGKMDPELVELFKKMRDSNKANKR